MFFLWKKMSPKSVVLLSRKKLQVFAKKFFEKKNLAYLCGYDLQNGVRNFLLNKCFSRYLSFSDFKVPKIVLHNKITNKTWSTKNQESSAHRFGGNYLTNHLVKFLQDRIKAWKVGALRPILDAALKQGVLRLFQHGLVRPGTPLF